MFRIKPVSTALNVTMLLGGLTVAGGPCLAGGGSSIPPGVGIRLTIEGPVFVDAAGMTLYRIGGRCSDRPGARVDPVTGPEGSAEDDDVPVHTAGSCLDKNPPLVAPADAEPAGDWTVHTAANGIRQWAYRGVPLHTSIKDREPGEINASYRTRLGRAGSNAAFAPLQGVPAGISYRETAAGLALIDHLGRTLYYPPSDCEGACFDDWIPLAAPAMATTGQLGKEWSILERPSGERQWAFEGRPLYRYRFDEAAHGEQVFGDVFGETWGDPVDGWSVAVLVKAPGRPAGVSVQVLPGDNELFSFGLPKLVYATAEGRTLYTLHCRTGDPDDGSDGSCDEVGDDPRFWLSYCGGRERCPQTWLPLIAHADASPIDSIWTVMSIDRNHPYRPVADDSRAIDVWAFRGRPVFTYAHDELPGDFYGDDHGFGTTGPGFQARPIPAYAHMREARLPVVSLK